jgi:hypothetical protein
MKKILLLLLFTSTSFAQIVDVNFSGAGNTSYSAWSNVNSFNYFGYGFFPGNSAWPAPINANEGLTTPTLNRTAGSPTGGGPYLASESIYFGSFSQVPNSLGGTLQILDTAPLFNLKTLVFQIQIGEATGFDFFQPSGLPKLTINNSTTTATFTNLVNRFQSGTFPSPETGEDEPVYINTWAYQWNFTTTESFDNYSIDFSGVTHSQIYALRLDGTDILQSSAVVPEPSVLGLLALAAAGIAGYAIRKRKRF